MSTNIIKVSKLHWGTQLDQFIDNVCEFLGKVFQKNLNLLPLISQEINQFKGVLASRQVFIFGSDDRIIWVLAKNGQYSVKEGHKILQKNVSNKVVSRAYTFFQNHIVFPKVGCFSWLALKHSILTSDRLNRLHIAPSFNYEESVDHLFVSCPFSYQCQRFILNKLNYGTPLQNNLWDLFQAWLVLYSKYLFANLRKCIPPLVVWAIWWEQNKRIFRK